VVVWNKIDATRAEPRAERDEYGRIRRVFLSARTGQGLGFLRQALVEAARAHAAVAAVAAAAGDSQTPAAFDPLHL
jgi:GTP-binding protein HflX